MNNRIFRKASLDRLASPDQLDQVVRMSTSRSWLALVALLLLTGVVAIWAYRGTVSTTVVGQGMIIRSGGLLTVVSRGSGLVAALKVDVGEHVRANQVVANIAQPALIQKQRMLSQAIAEEQKRQNVELSLKSEQSRIAIEAIERQRANTIRQMAELEQRATLAEQDIPVTDQLFGKGLVTKHQTIVARQSLVDVQEQVEELKAKLKQFDQQVDAARMEVRQAQLDLRSQLSTLEQNSEASGEELLRVQAVVVPVDGQVVEVKVSAGGTVTEDAPIVTIQPDHDATLQIVAYVPAAMAKECRPSMLVQVSPSVAKREEFGYMEGRVTFVADYPATAAAIMRQFQNESLISALSGTGPVSEIRASLDLDPSTFSGFRWSSSKGPAVRITAGTISNIHIVTRVQSPATLLMPWLRHGSGVE